MTAQDPASPPIRPLPASLLAGTAAGGWLGIVDGIRAAFEAPRPFGPWEFALGTAAFALGGALLGVAAWPVARSFRAPSAAARWLAPHAAVFLWVAAAIQFQLFLYWNPTGTGVGNAALKALALSPVAAALAFSFRARVRAFSERPARGHVVVAAVLAPLVLAAAAAATSSWRGPVDPAPVAVRREGTEPPPNVLVFLMDTLRTDHVAACGGKPGLSPCIDSLAREGVAFLQARTSGSWTKPSITSLFTGLRPERHGMLRARGAVPEGAPLLPSLLRAAGYRTAIFSDSPWPSPVFGFDRGITGPHLLPGTGALRATLAWRTWEHLLDRRSGAMSGDAHLAAIRGTETLADRTLDWIDDGGDEPWFAYLHGMEPHGPYAPRFPSEPGRRFLKVEPFHGVVPLDAAPAVPPEDLRDLLANYGDEVREADAAFGRMIEGLRSRGLLDRTLVVFLSDHGEEFHEHGAWRHEHSLYDEVLRIPLVLRLPGGRAGGRRVVSAVRIEDVLPTILETAGIRAAASFDGASLLPLLEEPAVRDRNGSALLATEDTRARCVISAGAKLLVVERGGRTERRLYDLAKDPGETRDLLATADPRLPTLAAALEESARLQAAGLPPRSSDAGGQLDGALRALGYTGGAEKR